jgi:hypothetical protein
MGTDTIINFNLRQDTIDLDHFASVQTAQQLVAPLRRTRTVTR